jgi:putative nucleotidyltransferase with HDIG domain
MEIIPNRSAALEKLTNFVSEPYLLLHSKMVALALEAYAHKFQEDQDLWYVTGLLHDLDYQQYPDKHPAVSLTWFAEWGYDPRLIHAVAAHAMSQPRIEADSLLAKTLIAVDELAGLLYAYSLMRPQGFKGMEAKSAFKKFKDKAFAAKVDREEIKYGVTMMGIDLKEHISFLINVYQTSDLLGQ